MTDERPQGAIRHAGGDRELAAAASQALRGCSEVPQTVCAEVERGYITLRGTAERLDQRYAATRAVQHLRGVAGVSNQVAIESPYARPADVLERIRRACERDAPGAPLHVGVTMRDGTAELCGRVGSDLEKRVAAAAAASAPGVTHVDDRLEIHP